MKRAIIIVIDSMGIGAMPDCREFGDVPECNTFSNVVKFNNGLNIPNLVKLGIANIDFDCPKELLPKASPIGKYGIMKEKSKGKDTTTGHWEIAGLTSERPFATFPQGFPQELIEKFIEKTNCGGILANIPASGTAIIEQLNEEHHQTGFPIVYTSADSVYQIAVDTDMIPLETLYKWCETARRLLDEGKYNVARVIARPYKVIDGKPTRISKDRRDYSMVPPQDTLLNEVQNKGGEVYAIGKIEDIFAKSGISKAVHIGSNKEGLELTLDAVKNSKTSDLIFTNLVDTDMLYGHRNDAKGYGKAIEEIDTYLAKIISELSDEDLLIITADHGCDPTVDGTDHTREYVPVMFYRKDIEPENLRMLDGFAHVTDFVKNWLQI